MDSASYAATSGGLQANRVVEVVAHNIANAGTVGFKAERVFSRQQEFADTLASTIRGTPARAVSDQVRAPGVVDVVTKTDFSPGPISLTGNPLDVALRQKNQFFVVDTPDGEALTRAGNFTTDSTGNLVTPDGFTVQGAGGGGIALPPGVVKIMPNGAVVVAGQGVGSLRVVSVDDAALQTMERLAGARFRSPPGGTQDVETADVVPQSVEMANISVVESMVALIAAQRSFEAYTKTAQTLDELNNTAIRNARGI